jgi:hypothetical protein
MSDAMLHGILQMPPELWSNDPIDILQRHGRYLEAFKRIMELERERDEARRERDASEELHRRRFGTLRKELAASNRGAETNAKVNQGLCSRLTEAERERDEAREDLAILKAECAKISEEFGLPPTVRPADGEIKRMINGWKEAIEERDEARRERDGALKERDAVWNSWSKALDEAREELARVRKELVASNRGAEKNAKVNQGLCAKLAEAERERDEARREKDEARREKDEALEQKNSAFNAIRSAWSLLDNALKEEV